MQNWEGKSLFISKNQLGRKEWRAEDNHSYKCHIYAKAFFFRFKL